MNRDFTDSELELIAWTFLWLRPEWRTRVANGVVELAFLSVNLYVHRDGGFYVQRERVAELDLPRSHDGAAKQILDLLEQLKPTPSPGVHVVSRLPAQFQNQYGDEPVRIPLKDFQQEAVEALPAHVASARHEAARGRWGIWGHDVDDLYFEGLILDLHRGVSTVLVGS